MQKLVLGLSLLFMLCGVAQARPRDEAMARAYRCAVQPVTRVWLDCYYGAAQPVRAGLGMSPVPPAQARLSEAPPAGGVPSDVALRDQVMTEAGRCAAVPEDRGWLDCFYAATNPVRAALALPPLAGGPAAAMTPAPPAPSPPPQRVSSFMPSIFGTTVIETRARMVNYSFDRNNRFTVTLDNGQVWQQLDGDSAIAHWRGPAEPYLVTITNGALGSHNLTVRGATGVFKVRRVS